ncbi:hypothetical protein BGZ80_001917 [Entomortierella chlamydospora]|uniref:Uncharacterized protein n=1 Tax=Entomortierella chlamydospora TaxID=101097 RepID=A0A9P6MR56_9FUNG|nr:hypothetical protein BGZ80_001917 [Entomortierella chlamydospora]
MTNIVGSVREEFERISRHHKAFDANSWNPAGLDLEIRACLLLNRFTRHLAVMYASPSCELIFNIDPDDLLGKPLLLFIRADDLASFVDQSDQARASPAVRHLRFWFQSPNCRYEIPCEAMLYGASDAMIMILRKCLPFRRKRFLTDYAPPECSSVASSYRASSFGGSFNQKYSRSEDSGFGGSGLHSIRGHSNKGYSSPSAYAGSPNDSMSSSISSSISSSSEYSSGTRAYKAPLRNIPVGSINSIRNLDGDHQRVRPLTSLRSNVDLAAELEVLPKLRELHTEDSEVVEEESELDIAVGRINLNDLNAIPVPERFIEEDSDDYMEFSDEGEDYYYGEKNYYEEEVEMPSSMRRY